MVQRLGVAAIAQQGARACLDPEREIGAGGQRRLGQPLERRACRSRISGPDRRLDELGQHPHRTDRDRCRRSSPARRRGPPPHTGPRRCTGQRPPIGRASWPDPPRPSSPSPSRFDESDRLGFRPWTARSRSSANGGIRLPVTAATLIALSDQLRGTRQVPGPHAVERHRVRGRRAARASAPASRTIRACRSKIAVAASAVPHDVAGHRCASSPSARRRSAGSSREPFTARCKIGIATARPSVCIRARPSSRRSRAPACLSRRESLGGTAQLEEDARSAEMRGRHRRTVGSQIGAASEFEVEGLELSCGLQQQRAAHRSHTRERRQRARGAAPLWRAGTHRAGRPPRSRAAAPPCRTLRPGMWPPRRPARARRGAPGRVSARRRAGGMRPRPPLRPEPAHDRPNARARWRPLRPVRPLPQRGARPGDLGLERGPSPGQALRGPDGARRPTLPCTPRSGPGDDGSEPGS